MTYCLGILLEDGLVLASDSRSNAGVDHITSVSKTDIFENAGERMIAVLSAGNLATTQNVVSQIRQASGSGNLERDIFTTQTLFDAATMVGSTLRDVLARDANFVSQFGDPNASFLVAGQINGEMPRVFQIYSAGNFIEAGPRGQFLQIGEAKYGKPILDRTLHYQMPLLEAAKVALISFDATIRSNLTVAAPIDMLCYQTNSFSSEMQASFTNQDTYFQELQTAYSSSLQNILSSLPTPQFG